MHRALVLPWICWTSHAVAQLASTISINTASCITSNLTNPSPTSLHLIPSATIDVASVLPAPTNHHYGLSYSVFHNPYNRLDDPGHYVNDIIAHIPSFASPSENNITYLTCGISSWPNVSTQLYLDGSYSPYGKLPGHATVTDMSAISMLLQGYLLVPVSGTYTFNGIYDEVGLYWLGSTAFNPWNETATGGSEDVPQNSNSRLFPGVTQSHQMELTQGDILPFAGIWSNAGGRAVNRLNVTFPNGTAWRANWWSNLLLPNPADAWVPRPAILSADDAAKCPQPPAADKNDTLCGLAGAQPYYHGKGLVDDKAQGLVPVMSNDYDASLMPTCQAAKQCMMGAKGCYFALYLMEQKTVFRCVIYGNITDPPPDFGQDLDSVDLSLGYKLPCGGAVNGTSQR